MPFIIVYDACTLYPAPLRDLLVRLGLTGLCQVKWTRRIMDECFRNIEKQRPDLKPEQLTRSRELLEKAIPDVFVNGYEELIEGVTGLPDPDDRHVVAAAIRCGAQVIVTFNMKDFPTSALSRYGMEAQHPDDFVRNLMGLDESMVAQAVRAQAAILKNPPRTPAEVLESLRKQQLTVSVARLKEILGV